MKTEISFVTAEELVVDERFRIFPEDFEAFAEASGMEPLPPYPVLSDNGALIVLRAQRIIERLKRDSGGAGTDSQTRVPVLVCSPADVKRLPVEILLANAMKFLYFDTLRLTTPAERYRLFFVCYRLFKNFRQKPEMAAASPVPFNLFRTISAAAAEYIYRIKPDQKTLDSFCSLLTSTELEGQDGFKPDSLPVELSMNRNSLRKYLHHLGEIIARGLIADFRAAFTANAAFFADGKISQSQKEARLFSVLDRLINPESIDKENRIRAFIAQKGIEHLSVSFSPFFEERDFSLTASVKSARDIEAVSAELRIAADILAELWKKL